MRVWNVACSFNCKFLSINRGDAELDTQGGKRTRVTLKVSGPLFILNASLGRRCGITVDYSVEELGGNRTLLSTREIISFPFPDTLLNMRSHISPYDRVWEIEGKNHEEMPIPGASGTCIEGVYRIDGSGGDQWNAYATGVVRFRIEHD